MGNNKEYIINVFQFAIVLYVLCKHIPLYVSRTIFFLFFILTLILLLFQSCILAFDEYIKDVNVFYRALLQVGQMD